MRSPTIAIIGGGGTGAALAHDLTLRGFRVTLLERGELTSGTTGRHHGELHSGARYAVTDPGIAKECARESEILRRIAPDAIEFNQGLFIALTGDDEDYCGPFVNGCEAAGIPAELLSPRQALRLEPNLNPKLRLAVRVPEGTMDAFRLPLHFFASAKRAGALIRTFNEVVAIEARGKAVSGLRVRDHRTGGEHTVSADLVVNAAGAWTGKVAVLAGLALPMSPSPGSLVAVKGRLANMVVSRLHPPGDGDTVVPQRNLSIIGTTGTLTGDPDGVACPPGDVPRLLAHAARLIPRFPKAPFHASWAAARPLAGDAGERGSRALSRDFAVHDHLAEGGLEGFITVTGGKATVLRAMAEAVADRVCARFGLSIPCATAQTPLDHYRTFFS